MRRRLAAPLVLFAAFWLASLGAPPAAAAPPAPEEESVLTADGVQLKGMFHATDKNPAGAPVVILMYAPGADRDMTKGDWAGLAQGLTAAGYHVFRFDWRGHGKSTEIKDAKKFWENPYLNGTNANFNRYIKGAGKKPLKDNLNVTKDIDAKFHDRFMPAYLNDLAAVRFHLDSKNDNKAVNTSSVYLVGAGDAAALGMAWLAAEWQRSAVYPTDNQLGNNVPSYEYVPQPLNIQPTHPMAGQTISGAVWLSADRPSSILPATVQKWVSKQAPKIRENNSMLFLHGDKDAAGEKMSKFFFNEVLVGDEKAAKKLNLNKLDQTFIQPVKGGAVLSGVALLGNPQLKVQDTIIQFLEAIQKEKAKVASRAREYNSPYFIDVRQFGLGAP